VSTAAGAVGSGGDRLGGRTITTLRWPLQNFLNKFQFPSNAENIERVTPMFAPTDALRWSPSETDDCVSLWLPAQRILWAGPAVIHGFPDIHRPAVPALELRRSRVRDP
jgi:hypothetical protein